MQKLIIYYCKSWGFKGILYNAMTDNLWKWWEYDNFTCNNGVVAALSALCYKRLAVGIFIYLDTGIVILLLPRHYFCCFSLQSVYEAVCKCFGLVLVGVAPVFSFQFTYPYFVKKRPVSRTKWIKSWKRKSVKQWWPHLELNLGTADPLTSTLPLSYLLPFESRQEDR